MEYLNNDNPIQKESFEIIGICMAMDRKLGKELMENVYNYAIDNEFISQYFP